MSAPDDARAQADATLARIVRCPGCRAALERTPHSGSALGLAFRCRACSFRAEEDADGILDLVAGSVADGAQDRSRRIHRRYDREAWLYDLGFGVLSRAIFGADHPRMHALAHRAGERSVVLDLPAGTGLFLPAPGERTTLVVASDLSRAMLRRARSRLSRDAARLARTRFVRADVMALPFADGVFEAVQCLNGLHVFPDAAGAARELARVRAPGGLSAGCAVHQPRAVRGLVARALVARKYMTHPFAEEELRALLVEAGLAREGDVARVDDEVYWESRG